MNTIYLCASPHNLKRTVQIFPTVLVSWDHSTYHCLWTAVLETLRSKSLSRHHSSKAMEAGHGPALLLLLEQKRCV